MTTQPLPVTASLRGASATASAERRGEIFPTTGSLGPSMAERGLTKWDRSGSTPFATVSVAQNISTDTLITLDVSSLVLAWDATPNRLTAMWLMTANGYGLSLRSMEYADATKHLVLRVTYSDGSTSDINPTVDVSIDGSSPDALNRQVRHAECVRIVAHDFAVSQAERGQKESHPRNLGCIASSQNYAGIGIRVNSSRSAQIPERSCRNLRNQF